MKVPAMFVVAALICTHAAAWEYPEELDKMTGKTGRYAVLKSDNSLALEFPYGGENHGYLTVRQHPTHGLNVIVAVEKGQILCSAYDGCSVVVRFDDGKPQRFSATPPADHSSNLLFIESEPRFISAAQKAKRILIQAAFYQNGNQVLEFTSPEPLRWALPTAARKSQGQGAKWPKPPDNLFEGQPKQ